MLGDTSVNTYTLDVELHHEVVTLSHALLNDLRMTLYILRSCNIQSEKDIKTHKRFVNMFYIIQDKHWTRSSSETRLRAERQRFNSRHGQ
jgi:hypothetical protein